jgi:hypothetical protein
MIDAKQAQHPAPQPPAHVLRADALVSGEATTVHILPDIPWTYVRPKPGNAAGADGWQQAALLLQPAADPLATKALAILLTAVKTYIGPRILLGSAVRVAPARLTDINVVARLRCAPQVQPSIVLEAAIEALAAYFEPITGGALGTGWGYGQPPDPNEVAHLVDGIPGVVAVDDLVVNYVPTMRLPDMARLGVDTLLADLPFGSPALIYGGLPRLRCLSLSAKSEAA